MTPAHSPEPAAWMPWSEREFLLPSERSSHPGGGTKCPHARLLERYWRDTDSGWVGTVVLGFGLFCVTVYTRSG